MIHQNDILVFAENIDRGDDRCVMVAMEDEYVWEDLPNKVKVKELNDWLPLGSVRTLEATVFKMVGHVRPGDTKESIVRRVLPEGKWEFSQELYQMNRGVA
ncbi:MAG: hypothetical protein J6N46_05740 [Bacteroidales bacterium]|nr:hypothetical protein [Bacteroidales bacterium]MBO6249251.1 hypothetical protein [Bacteroidales bacterium]